MLHLSRPTQRLTTLASVLLITLFLTSPGTAHAQAIKIGVVDFQRAVEETEGDKALAKLEKAVKKRKGELRQMEDDIVKLESDFKENMAMWSEDKQKENYIKIQEKVAKYQQTRMKYEQEMREEQAKVLGGIQEKMQRIAAAIAQEKGLDMMVERNEGAILYYKEAFDHTDELIKRYRAGGGGK